MKNLIKIRVKIQIPIISALFVFSSIQCDYLNREQTIAKVGNAKLTHNDVEYMVEQIGSEEDFLNTPIASL